VSVALETPFEFDVPAELVAREPAEARGLRRDGVRLLVSRRTDDVIVHTRFRELPDFLAAGDLLVVNRSATIPAAFDGVLRRRGADEHVLLHLSTPRPPLGVADDSPIAERADEQWVIELRRLTAAGHAPLCDAQSGETVLLAGGGTAHLLAPFRGSARLWIADLRVGGGGLSYAARYGAPIRYGYVTRTWPLSAYQTIFASEPGSAEMPSAARGFTHDLVERLARKGVAVASIVLHTGVSSLEADESPYPEWYRVPRSTARAIERARAAGGRIIAVGTTVVRALESVALPDGAAVPGSGWTDLTVTPGRELRAVDALLTGFHTPKASHLWMLEALAGGAHVSHVYRAALRHRYLWHEFGDLHLIV
jgi:S-adenosylmethionine:tRNA ribosyltransferase-isomerase